MDSRVFYHALVASGLPRLVRRLRAGAAVFCFHNVVLPEDVGVGDPSLHMNVRSFETIMRWIRST